MGETADANIGRVHRAFIAANWEALAALAWRGFLASGRGALRVKESLFLDACPGDILIGRVVYVCERSGPVAELVRSYAPEQEIICTIDRLDGTARTYQLRGPVIPPEAYQSAVDTGKREE